MLQAREWQVVLLQLVQVPQPASGYCVAHFVQLPLVAAVQPAMNSFWPHWSAPDVVQSRAVHSVAVHSVQPAS